MGCFYVLAAVNNASVTMGMQVYLEIVISENPTLIDIE